MNWEIPSPQSASPNGLSKEYPASSGGELSIPRDAPVTVTPSVLKFYDYTVSPYPYDPIQSLVHRYMVRGLSTLRAAEIVGLSYDDFIQQVLTKGFRLPMGAETLEEFKAEDENLRAYLRRR